jgi:aminoglycoside phosphotransferase (APT) family kinase protein
VTQPPRKMHVDEIEVSDATVRGLVSSQFRQWSEKSLTRLPDSGTDSAIYRLGDELGIRLPRIHWAVEQVDKEWPWLRRLAPSLPISIPVPIGKGQPGEGYPHPWLVYPLTEGKSLDRAPHAYLGCEAASSKATERSSWGIAPCCPHRRSGECRPGCRLVSAN